MSPAAGLLGLVSEGVSRGGKLFLAFAVIIVTDERFQAGTVPARLKVAAIFTTPTPHAARLGRRDDNRCLLRNASLGGLESIHGGGGRSGVPQCPAWARTESACFIYDRRPRHVTVD